MVGPFSQINYVYFSPYVRPSVYLYLCLSVYLSMFFHFAYLQVCLVIWFFLGSLIYTIILTGITPLTYVTCIMRTINKMESSSKHDLMIQHRHIQEQTWSCSRDCSKKLIIIIRIVHDQLYFTAVIKKRIWGRNKNGNHRIKICMCCNDVC